MDNIAPLLMHPRNYEDYPNETLGWPYTLRSEKLNGVRGILNPRTGYILSKHKREFVPLRGTFLVPEAEKNFGASVWLDGEITWPGHTLQDIAGLLGQIEPTAEAVGELVFNVFDMNDSGDFLQRYNFLKKYFVEHGQDYLKLVPAEVVHTIPHPKDYDWSNVPESLEGYVYRNPHGLYSAGLSYDVLKHKRLRDAEFVCVGIKEGKGKFKGMFGGATLRLSSNHTFDCGGGFLTVLNRQQLWEHPPIGKLVTVRYPYLSDDGVPLQAQFVSVRNYE